VYANDARPFPSSPEKGKGSASPDYRAMPVLRMRLALHGCINRPFYHIVVANNTSKRDGKHIEQVSSFHWRAKYGFTILAM